MIRITEKRTIRMERQRMMNKMDNFISFIVNRREREREARINCVLYTKQGNSCLI